jgi:hypothetical protein
MMQPPKTINVLDRHQGFTALTRTKVYEKEFTPGTSNFVGWRKVSKETDTLWRPGSLLKRGTTGTLQEFDEHSFYQLNNNVTKAIYKVPGYAYRVAVWFDNATGERIA